tara:strand:+ start:17 stop:211 length:195 start_codon:yes stop_codon:yes gene_type:complete
MDSEKIRLKKLIEEQKTKSRNEDLINSYIDNSKNLEDKIAAVKLKHMFDKTAILSSIKSLMKKK